MASKHVLKLSSINDLLDNDNKIMKKAENALESNHVESMQFDADLMMIRGREVHTSMKDKFYLVEITLNKSEDIISANCACSRGIKCHHIATLALFGHYNISVTDKEYDPLWAENLSLLEDFYIKQYLPKLTHNLISAET
ncbi:uncharacterized protein [Leptinotarsa decemlineata]|uniref:uncharacterized protein n=1 Tax=Leptinotarsa decemlineata TaxID=7539 RepID=UPI003D309962